MESGFFSTIFNVSDWIIKFVYLNFLWIIFSLLGLVIFGFFPATTAMFSIVRKWNFGDNGIKLFPTFWKAYKREFMKSNILGYILSIAGYVLFLDLSIVKNTSSALLHLTYYPLIIIIVLFLLTALYVFPVLVHFDSKLIQVIKNAFLIMISHPVMSLLMSLGVAIIVFILYVIPIILLLFGGSVLAFIMMRYTNFAFVKVQEQKQISE